MFSFNPIRDSTSSLPGALWGIVAYFNPGGYENKKVNYRRFRESSKRQGLPLIVVEAATAERSHELSKNDADLVVQVRTSSVLWQKERLLNIALEHLPAECDKVVWLDADVLFQDDNWVGKTSSLLEKFPVVQPFSNVVYLHPEMHTIPPSSKDLVHVESWGNALRRSAQPKEVWRLNPKPGHAVAARRSILDHIGFYDKMIVGGGDSVMMSGFTGIDPDITVFLSKYSPVLHKDAKRWCQQAYELVGGDISCVSGNVYHLWHGVRGQRMYCGRLQLLKDFNPHTDIVQNTEGCWEWAGGRDAQQRAVEAYFPLRAEEGNEPSDVDLQIIQVLQEEIRQLHQIYQSQHWQFCLFQERVSQLLAPSGTRRRRWLIGIIRHIMHLVQ